MVFAVCFNFGGGGTAHFIVVDLLLASPAPDILKNEVGVWPSDAHRGLRRRCLGFCPRGRGTQGNPREPKGTQGNPRQPKTTQGNPREPKGAQGSPREPQGNPREPKGAQGNPREPKGTQGSPREPKGAQGNPSKQNQQKIKTNNSFISF